MNKVKLTSFICGGIISLTGTSLLAQQSSSTGTSPSTDRTSSSSSTTFNNQGSSSTSSSLDSGSGHWQHHSGQNVRLSNLMNASVQSQDGKSLGSIRDFIVDPQSGHVQFAVLSLSPAGGASDTSTSGRETVPSSRSSLSGTSTSGSSSALTGKLIPVPWQLFSQSWRNSSSSQSSATAGTSGAMGNHTLVLNIDESKLQSAPSFNASDWNEMNQSSFDQRVYSYYGVNRMSGAGTSGSSISGQGTSTTDHLHSQGTQDSSSRDYGTGTATGGTGAKGGASDLENKTK